MGLRGPKPENSNIIGIDPRPKERPKPFSNMTGAAKTVWKRIVDDLPADFYADHELDQLRSYCEAAALNARASSEMSRKGTGPVVAVETKVGTFNQKSPWFAIYKETSAVLASLGTKLRLNKNSKLAGREAAKVPTGKSQSKRAGLMFGD